jgi:5-methylcytosine-specific restriction endonuclease McrA
MYKEKAYSVKSTDIPIRSQHVHWFLPSVIALKEQKKIKKEGTVRYSKRALLERDRYRCQYIHPDTNYTHEGRLTVDHVVPVSRGGKTEWSNVVVACERCQMLKRDLYLQDIILRLRKEPIPFKSSHLETRLQSRLRRIIRLPEHWREYVWSRDEN